MDRGPFKVPSQNLHRMTEENKEKPRLKTSVSQPGFEGVHVECKTIALLLLTVRCTEYHICITQCNMCYYTKFFN